MKNIKVKEWIECGELSEGLKDTDAILDESGDRMDSANACEILGGGILFKGEDGNFYTVVVETVIAKANPKFVKLVLEEKAERERIEDALYDQYNNEVPDDLVTLPDYENLSSKEIKIVDKARWYEAVLPDGTRSAIMASAKELKGLSEDDPHDSGIDLQEAAIEIFLIDDVLKRHGPQDGWFHA